MSFFAAAGSSTLTILESFEMYSGMYRLVLLCLQIAKLYNAMLCLNFLMQQPTLKFDLDQLARRSSKTDWPGMKKPSYR
jgi:hypothetical protein